MNAITRNADQMPNGRKSWADAPAGWYPLSLSQQGIWRSSQLQPKSWGSNNLAFCATVLGQIDSRRLAKALDTLAARHPILRACIKEHCGEPGQVVKSRISVPLASLDSTNLDPFEFEELLRKQCARSFDLAIAPLMRASVYHRNADESVLSLVFDRLIIDSWSFGRLIQELGELLDGFGDSLRLARDKAPDESTYLDYVYREQEWIDSDQAVEQLAYWRTALREEYPRLNLYGGEVSKQAGHAERDCLSFLLSEELVRGLRGLADSNGVTLHTVVLAGYLICLRRLTGEARIAVGAPMPTRAGGIIGNFENLVAIGAEFHPDLTVRDLLWAVGGTLARAEQNQAYPFGELVRCLNPVHADRPYFQTLFAFHQPHSELEVVWLAGCGSDGCTVNWGGLDLKPHPLAFRSGGSDFALVLDVVVAGETLSGAFTFATASFERGTIARYCGYWRTLLEGLVIDDDALVDRLPMLGAGERLRVLDEWNATAADYPQDRGIHQLFEDQAVRTPDAVAVVHGEQRLSYAELNAAANRLAHHLRALGVGPRDYVATMLERSINLVVAELAALKCAAAYVPIDPTFPADRQAFVLADCGARVLLTSSDIAVAGPSAVRRVDVDAPLPEGSGDNLEVQADGTAAAYVMYTSGSTGQPKGVVVLHRGIGRLVLNNGYAAFDAGDRIAFAANPAFDATTLEVWAPLLNGGAIVVIDQEVFLEPARLAAYLKEYEVTALFITTALFNHYAATRPDAFAGLRFLLTGGERADPVSFAQILRVGPPQHLIHCYGPTETTTFAITHDIRDVAEGARSIPLGRPIANTQIYILDRYGEPVPVGVAGEIHIGGAGVARGYLNRPELTAERFLPDPFCVEPGTRMYKTGDLGRWLADGTLEFLGRNDFQIKLRGFRIELGEIEARLAEHPALREAAVIAREDAPGDKRLVAYVVPVQDDTTEPVELAAALRTYLVARLPEYMVPAVFVRLAALPLTPNGKLDRRALPAPEGDAYARQAYEPPQGETEQTLAALWAELLGLERVGRHDQFFELGGHSLLAVQLMERLRRLGLGTEVVPSLFATPTLADLAATLGSHRDMPVPANAITPDSTTITPDMLPLIELAQPDIDRIVAEVPGGMANLQDLYALSPLQDGILFHHLLASQGDPYLLIFQMTFAERSLLDRYLAAIQQVVDRHDILRTAFVWEQLSTPAQVVWRHALLSVTEVELDAQDGSASEQLARRFDPRRHRIDLTQAPLLRCVIAREPGTGRWLLLELLHHLIGDHATLEIMHAEVQAFMAGRGDELAAPQPFRNLVAEVRLGASQDEHERFFRAMLADIDEPTTPFGLADVHRDGSRVEEAHRMLPQALNHRLRTQARRLGVSLASLCHLAWGQVVARTSGREQVVFGTVLFGRMQTGADRAMGLFINTLPLRLDLDGTGVEDSVRRTHAWLAELLRHEHASLALAQRCSGVAAPAPLFSALLNYVHNTIPAPGSDVSDALHGIEWLGVEERTNYPFVLSVEDFGQALGLTAQVVQPLSPNRVCGLMQRVLEHLAEALEQAPGMPVRQLDVLPPGERELLLETWNRIEAPYPEHLCLHQLFEAQVRQTPEAVALVQDEVLLSYAELNARANHLAHRLITQGVRPDERVAICVERSLTMVVGLLAILKAGGAYVPLDPSYPAERLAQILGDAGPVLLLSDAAGRQALLGAQTEDVPGLALDESLPDAPGPSDLDPDPQALGLTSSHLAYVIYTSGSTGTPKGVMVEHAQVVRLFEATQDWYRFNEQDVWCLFHSFAFDFSVWELWGALRHGGRLVIVPRDVARSAQDFHRLVCETGVTVLNQTPSAFKAFIEAEAQSGLQHQLRYVIFGGEALEPSILKPWYARHPDQRPQLVNMYGITETTVHVTHRPLRQADTAQPGSPIGLRIPDLRVYLLDAHGQPVPLGAVGELHIGGAGVARGYLNRPELTAERFLKDPFSPVPGARMYRTGDLARYLPDGNLEFLGRNDQQVKIRGFRIEPGEIEARLADHPAVREAAVIAREDSPGDKRLVAYVVAAQDDANEPAELATALRNHLSARLPEYMVPTAFVRLDALPLTPNGKLDRRALPAPEGDAYARRGYAPPEGEIEHTLAAVWAELLGLERVGRHDHFFELGGDSLKAIQVCSALKKKGYRLDVAELLRFATIKECSRHIRTLGSDESPPVTQPVTARPLPGAIIEDQHWLSESDHPLSPAQYRFLRRGLQNPHHFVIPLLVKIRVPLCQADLLKALEQALRGQDSHNVYFRQNVATGELRQVYREWEPSDYFEHIDLSGTQTQKHRGLVTERVRAVCHSFDIWAGPLFRIVLFEHFEGQATSLVYFAFHHLISDGVSLNLLFDRVREYCLFPDALAQRAQENLATLRSRTSYLQWCRSLHAYARSGEWLRKCASSESSTPVAQSSANHPPAQTRPRHSEMKTIDYVLLRGEDELREFGRATATTGTTPFTFLLATFLMALRQTGLAPKTLHIQTSQRDRSLAGSSADMCEIMGYFAAAIPVHLSRFEEHPGQQPADFVRSIGQELGESLGGGLGYLMTRYLLPQIDPLFSPPEDSSSILFHYLSQDPLDRDDDFYAPVDISPGPSSDPENASNYLLNVTMTPCQGFLETRLYYSPAHYKDETLAALACAHREKLKGFIIACARPTKYRSPSTRRSEINVSV